MVVEHVARATNPEDAGECAEEPRAGTPRAFPLPSGG
jgi:hypothetical protein